MKYTIYTLGYSNVIIKYQFKDFEYCETKTTTFYIVL